MEKYDIYKDISSRTDGEIFIGVVGPVRTGKSSFVSKFLEEFVLPNINNKLQKQITTDEMPQSADGKIIMTTQPKFVPGNAVKVSFKNKLTASVRLVDCVGYLVDGAMGHEEDDKPRNVKTPWDENEMPFEKAAEIGTRKVIEEYSTIGIVVTTDGSFTDIPRSSYEQAEDRVINELKELNRPFVVVLNCKDPSSENSLEIARSIELKHDVSVICINVIKMGQNEINNLMEKILLEFPMGAINLDIPKWMQALPADSPIISEIVDKVRDCSQKVKKMRDFADITNAFDQNDKLKAVEVEELNLGCGTAQYKLYPQDDLFYKILSSECGEEIDDDYELLSYIKSFSDYKRKFGKIKDALEQAESDGYGIVCPSVEEMTLEEPVLVKQNGRYGVKLKATAPSLHIIKVDVTTEVSPTVGNEKQGEDMVNFLTEKYEQDPKNIWETNMFGRSLNDLVNDGLKDKLLSVPKDAQIKMNKTLTRMVNENRGGMICILL